MNLSEQETWKTIQGEKYFQVSNFGRVRSIDMPILCKNGSVHHIKKGTIRKQMDNGHGYKWVRLHMDEKPRYVHRLVMETFSPDHQEAMTDINHIDGDKSNNRLENLEWCTKSQNMVHAYKTGLRDKGDAHGQSKLKFFQICEIRKLYENGETQQAIADKYGVSRQHVGRLVRMERRVAY